MIKGFGFGKLLKQFSIILLISCFTLFLGSFVSAGYNDITVKRNGVMYEGVGGSTFQVAGNGNLLTQYIGVSRRMLAFNVSSTNKQYFFWSNGLPYFYYFNDNHNFLQQGFFTSYYVCDELHLGDTAVSNCSKNPITSSFLEAVSPFFNSMKSSDLFGYYYGEYQIYSLRYFGRVCFSSSEYNRSICFVSDDGQSNSLIGNSLGLSSNVSIGDIDGSIMSFSPGGSSVNGGSSEAVPSEVAGDVVYSTCTNKYALSWYKKKGYNEKLCYSSYNNNDDIFQTGGNYVGFALTGIDIEDVRFDTAGYRRYGVIQTGNGLGYSEWFQYWRKTYDVYKHNPEINNPFVGVPVSIFTLMGNIDVYGLAYSNNAILDFCDLLLYRNLNDSYNGITKDVICNMSAIDIIADSVGVHAESGQVAVGSSWDGITNRGWSDGSPSVIPSWGTGYLSGHSGTGLSFYSDGKTFENNYFNLLSSVFKYPESSGSGILPGYIILALCGLILFRFIRH